MLWMFTQAHFASHAVSGCDSSCDWLVIYIAEMSELAPLGVFLRLYVSDSLPPALPLSRLPSLPYLASASPRLRARLPPNYF